MMDDEYFYICFAALPAWKNQKATIMFVNEIIDGQMRSRQYHRTLDDAKKFISECNEKSSIINAFIVEVPINGGAHVFVWGDKQSYERAVKIPRYERRYD